MDDLREMERDRDRLLNEQRVRRLTNAEREALASVQSRIFAARRRMLNDDGPINTRPYVRRGGVR